MKKLLLGLAVVALSGCAASTPPTLPADIFGVTHVDAGTDYVYSTQLSQIGGACEGWNTLTIARKGDLFEGKQMLMCWKRDGNYLMVNTARGDRQKSGTLDTMLDIRGPTAPVANAGG